MSKQQDMDEAAAVLSQLSQLGNNNEVSRNEKFYLIESIGATCTLQPSSIESDMLFSLPDDHSSLSSRSVTDDDIVAFNDTEHPYAVNLHAETCMSRLKSPPPENEHLVTPEIVTPKNKNKPKKKDFECKYCHKTIKGHKKDLIDHMGFHTNIKPFACELCDRAFVTKSDLKRHGMVHNTNKVYRKCSVCSSSFRDQATLTRHMKTHSANKLYTCVCCKKEFSRLDTYKCHMNSHNEALVFKCNVCSANFKYKSSYNRHMKTHDVNFSMPCEMCDNIYYRVDALKRHMKVKHGIEDKDGRKSNEEFAESSDSVQEMSLKSQLEKVSGVVIKSISTTEKDKARSSEIEETSIEIEFQVTINKKVKGNEKELNENTECEI